MLRKNRVYATALFVVLLSATGAFGQAANTIALNDAQTAVQSAEAAGAATLATTLYEEARWRLASAQEGWSAPKSDKRDAARLRAAEALWAARAAAAKAQWLGANATIRDLQSDINRLGGKSTLTPQEESANLAINRGNTSKERADYAQSLIVQARAAGGSAIVGGELDEAEARLKTARNIIKGSRNSESADHVAYVAEMMARRAYYLARAQEARRFLPNLQFDRTRLAQAESERLAVAERAQREQAERDAAAVRQRLAEEQANRQAEASELERLRAQVEENRRLIDDRVEQNRLARVEAERRLDELMRKYESAIINSSPNEADVLRRQLEDQQITIRAMQARERLDEQAMTAEVDRLNAELQSSRQRGDASAQIIADREAEITRRQQLVETIRRERDEAVTRYTTIEQRHATTVAEAQKRRLEAEAAQQALQLQADAARQQATQAQADAERARQEAEAAKQELATARTEMQQREARRLQMETELAKLASTRREARGLIVTLPGIFFDTGKSVLKAASMRTLDRIATQLNTDANIKIVVEGHTDSVGSETSNQKLSDARANAVRDYLVSKGVIAGAISATGFGEAQPLASNKTASGRQQNRRVELVINN